ncbi:hypothetical protein GCM10009557_14940 [Virgisporangium ochraceum]|uniref:Uncharacterized protein n=1 Tax=Virgisporangium ochraceum TaxID=65505 RepID=A0A8J3ZLI9_9ACTN|nr:hypothetical protein [Virgisporangium ochraceum]GIJ66287.1 hypothetical protein Voc01_012040 [Virgisporangium ochraceum]
MTDRIYPLPRPDDDPKFTYGLLFDVRQVLIDHGYPAPEHGRDLVNLQLAILDFLYGQRSGDDHDG